MVWFYSLISALSDARSWLAHHAVGTCVCLFDALRLFQGLLAHNLHPVLIGIQNEGDVPHLTICQLLLELVACVFEALACRLDVIHGDGQVSEASWFGVA